MDTLSWLLVLGFFVLSLGAAIVTTVVVWVKRKRVPLLYGLLLVTVLILSCSFPFLFIGHNLRDVTSSKKTQVEETDVADLVIQTSVDLPVVKDQSTYVEVFISQLGQFPSSSRSTPQPTVELTPVGTPGVPIVKAFGPGYNVSAVAQLNASTFDVAPQDQPPQSLDQPSFVRFTWTATPKYAGQQVLAVTVTGRWTPKSSGPVIERPLASQFLSINVIERPRVVETPKPFFSFSQLDVTQLLVVLLSSVLNVPWIIELLKKRQETKKEKSDTSASAAPSPTEKGQKEPKTTPVSPSDTQHTPSRRQKKKKQPSH